MNIFFTSDNHFGHANIIKYCNRPFDNVDEMDEAMIRNWNEVVSEDDMVYHLGDFTLGNSGFAQSIFRRLNGNISILNNSYHHDKRWIPSSYIGVTNYNTVSGYVYSLPPIFVLDASYKVIVLCHFPMAVWDRKHYGSIHLHGHSHGEYKYKRGTLAFDVGVDSWGFTPVSLEEVIKKAERISK